jgi:hypothetical protein
LELLANGEPAFAHGRRNLAHATPTPARSRTLATTAPVSGT